MGMSGPGEMGMSGELGAFLKGTSVPVPVPVPVLVPIPVPVAVPRTGTMFPTEEFR